MRYKKWSLVMFLAVLFLFGTTVEARSVEDKNAGYSIEVPDAWQVSEKDGRIKVSKATYESVMVAVYPPFPLSRTNEENDFIIKEINRMLMDRFPKATVDFVKKDKIANQPALFSSFSSTLKDGTTVKILRISFWLNQSPAEIFCMTKNDQLDEEMKGIAYSLKLKAPTTAEWQEKGYQAKENKNYTEAISAFTKATELDAKNATSFYEIAYASAELKNYPQAIAAISKAIELKPKKAFYYNERAYSYIASNEAKAAMADANKAIQLQPEVATSYSARGNAYAKLKQYDEAIGDFEKVKALRGDMVEANFNLAQLFELKGNQAEALVLYQKVAQESKLPEAIKEKVNDRVNGNWDSYKEWI
ncbi:tetratricopeptide repeat protein [Azotosporobacter soli]|uniref:tetratricopeptide repeat protein n=1 Tax=Azotosporobacter soli TaxID=3055040 RepID=UPI0031FE7483